MIRSRQITQHARGQPCQIRLDVCNGNPETTVFAHLNSFGKGMGIKAPDYAGFFACSACHEHYDQRPHKIENLAGYLLNAVVCTWGILIRDKIIAIPEDGDKPKTIKPRKPKAERTKIQGGQKIQSRPFTKSPKTNHRGNDK